jgi:hypothetical protein
VFSCRRLGTASLRQVGLWTYGALLNHAWSFAGDDDRADLSSTFMQPFLACTTPGAWTFTLQSEATYDWEGEQWSIPVAGIVSKFLNIGGQNMSISAGARYWAETPYNGPEGFSFHLVLAFRFSQVGCEGLAAPAAPAAWEALRVRTPSHSRPDQAGTARPFFLLTESA